MRLTERVMLRLHVEAVWGVKLPPVERTELVLLPESAQPDWRLYAAELAGERILIWHKDLVFEERTELLARLNEVQRLSFSASAPSLPGLSREVAFRLEAEPMLDLMAARQLARRLTSADAALIEAFWPGHAREMMRSAVQPLLGVIVDGRLLSLAHSSRRTAEACELGIDTLPEARRRGYALAATVAWSAAISAEGLTPIYSALAENTASLRLAEAAGYRAFARATMLA